MSSIAQRVLFGSLCLFLLGVPAAAHATEWDQAKVTEVAEELANSANAVYGAIYRSSGSSQVGSGQAKSYMRLKDRIRVARTESRHLAKALRDGKGKDETFHAWERLMTVVRDAREIGRRMFLEKPSLDEIEKANGFIDQLSPYYATKSD